MRTSSSSLLQLLLIIGLLNISGGLILPLVGPLFLDAAAGIIPGSLSLEQRYFSYSAVLTLFAVGLCIGEVFWGHISDHLGRKRALIFSLFGLVLGYISCGFAVLMQNLVFFTFGRFVLGLMSGSQTIVIAAIIDQSKSLENKAIYLSWVGIATCVGLLSGPLLGGFLLPSKTNTFHYALPFFFMVLIVGVNLMILPFFREIKTEVKEIPPLSQLIKSFLIQFRRHQHLRWVMLGYLLFGFGWFLYYQYIPLYLAHSLQYEPHRISYFMIVMIFVYFSTLFLIYPRLLKLADHAKLISGSLLIMSISIGLFSLFTASWAAWLFSLIFVSANAIAYITWMALFSDQSDHLAQGWAMSVNGLMYALAWLLAAATVGFLGNLGKEVPFGVMSLTILASAIVAWHMRQRNQDK